MHIKCHRSSAVLGYKCERIDLSESVLQGMYMITLEDKNYSRLVVKQHGLQTKCVCCGKQAADSRPVFLENHPLQHLPESVWRWF